LGIRPLTKSLHEGKLSFLFEIAQERTVSDGMGWSAKEKASDDESLVMHLECGIMRKGGDN